MYILIGIVKDQVIYHAAISAMQTSLNRMRLWTARGSNLEPPSLESAAFLNLSVSVLEGYVQDIYKEAIDNKMLTDRNNIRNSLPYATDGIDNILVNQNQIKILDLHGYPLMVAEAAVDYMMRGIREGYQQGCQNGPNTLDFTHILIITGKGNHINSLGSRRVLRKEIESMFIHRYEGITLSFSSNNDGCIIVTREAVMTWLQTTTGAADVDLKGT